MNDVEALLMNPSFEGMTVSEAVDFCMTQDPGNPMRYKNDRAKYRDDEKLVREYAENPHLTEGLWRMHRAGKINCTCEAIAMHFPEFDEETREAVITKIQQLVTDGDYN